MDKPSGEMKIHTCYTVRIRSQVEDGRDRPVDDSLMKESADTCLAALRVCTAAYLAFWAEELEPLSGVRMRKRGEELIHTTKSAPAVCPGFDRQFPYMPSGMRRAIVADALGMVKSYKSNLKNWEETDPKDRGRKPDIGFPKRYELTFYFQERDVSRISEGLVRLKLFNGKTWDWYTFRIAPAEARYISTVAETRKMLSPVVEKKRGRYFIRFCFEEQRKLIDTEPITYRILAVDLGINHAASWCVMEADGTVHARGVISLPAEEDRLRHLANRIRQYQHAGKKSRCVYRWCNSANKALAIETARAIIKTAELYDVDCIVFEHLDTHGKKRGRRLAQRLHLWRANDVQNRVTVMAHRDGMRIRRVCAWNTSRLAFDGSGKVRRGEYFQNGKRRYNYSVAVFPNGKQYNCDVSASYNIGARFFLREYLSLHPDEPLPAATQRTYRDLVSIQIRKEAASAA